MIEMKILLRREGKIMSYINDAKQMKFEVLKNVAKLAYEGKLEKLIGLPFEIIKGNRAKYRCCVYKEREIIRERTILASGNNIDSESPNANIFVVPAACEGCPINRYTVTENCQKCLAKKCVAACKFGAITVTGRGAYIDPEKCKECGKCKEACPYNAISDTLRPCVKSCPVDAISMNKDKQAKIEYDKCISCGACMTGCPFGAISDKSQIVDVIKEIKSEGKIVAVFAPALEGQFGKHNVASLKNAIKKLGFDEVYEVSLGADATAFYEAKELKKNKENNKKMTTSCCPAFVSMIKKHYKDLLPLVSTTASPMTAIARYIKEKNKNAKVVFIGPCIAKKQEIKDIENTADYVLTFEELVAMFSAKGIKLEQTDELVQDGSIYGKNFSLSSGVSESVKKAFKEQFENENVSCKACAGGDECKKALLLLKADRLPEDIIEGMLCKNGCISGPGTIDPYNVAIKNRNESFKTLNNVDIGENLKNHGFKDINMHVKHKSI